MKKFEKAQTFFNLSISGKWIVYRSTFSTNSSVRLPNIIQYEKALIRFKVRMLTFIENENGCHNIA